LLGMILLVLLCSLGLAEGSLAWGIGDLELLIGLYIPSVADGSVFSAPLELGWMKSISLLLIVIGTRTTA
jgi:hypothetical protein